MVPRHSNCSNTPNFWVNWTACIVNFALTLQHRYSVSVNTKTQNSVLVRGQRPTGRQSEADAYLFLTHSSHTETYVYKSRFYNLSLYSAFFKISIVIFFSSFTCMFTNLLMWMTAFISCLYHFLNPLFLYTWLIIEVCVFSCLRSPEPATSYDVCCTVRRGTVGRQVLRTLR